VVREGVRPYTANFNTTSTVGLESSPVAAAVAGLRANKARYFKNTNDHVFTVEPAGNARTARGHASCISRSTGWPSTKVGM
jgi:hypothetical protein